MIVMTGQQAPLQHCYLSCKTVSVQSCHLLQKSQANPCSVHRRKIHNAEMNAYPTENKLLILFSLHFLLLSVASFGQSFGASRQSEQICAFSVFFLPFLQEYFWLNARCHFSPNTASRSVKNKTQVTPTTRFTALTPRCPSVRTGIQRSLTSGLFPRDERCFLRVHFSPKSWILGDWRRGQGSSATDRKINGGWAACVDAASCWRKMKRNEDVTCLINPPLLHPELFVSEWASLEKKNKFVRECMGKVLCDPVSKKVGIWRRQLSNLCQQHQGSNRRWNH